MSVTTKEQADAMQRNVDANRQTNPWPSPPDKESNYRVGIIDLRSEQVVLRNHNIPPAKANLTPRDRGMKICKDCNKDLPCLDFYTDKRGRLFSRCKKCHLIRTNKWRRDNPERIRELGRQHRVKNRDIILARLQSWKESEKGKQWTRDYYEKNKVALSEKGKRWWVANKHKVKGYLKKHRESDRIAYNARAHKYRCKIRTGEVYSSQQWTAMCELYGNKCLSCGKAKKLTADHVMPVSRDGTNDISNIQPLCVSCNSSKGASFIDFRPKDSWEHLKTI